MSATLSATGSASAASELCFVDRREVLERLENGGKFLGLIPVLKWDERLVFRDDVTCSASGPNWSEKGVLYCSVLWR